jgi:hypothetical protein
MEKFLLLANIASTLFLTGVIWVVQLVQYPFFAYIKPESFTKYHDDYRFWITPVVAPPMIVELLSSIFLVFYPPENIDSRLILFGLILTVITWASTFFRQVPLHEKLAAGFDAKTHAALVHTNWLRTAAWSLRALLVTYLAWKVFRF